MPDFLLNHIRIIYKTRIEINITIIYTNTPWFFSLAPSLPSHLKSKRKTIHNSLQASCRIPDDCIDKNRYPLFMARSVLRELIESLPSTRSL